MDSFDSFPRPQSADGPATILAIGTANPANVMDQMEYADYYFRITNAEDKTELKRKFKRICEKSTIKKRHMSLTEEILKKNPSLCEYMAPSFDARQQIVLEEVPRLAKEAAAKAIKEWGRPTSDITHLPVNMASLHAMRKAQRARGPATIMAIGTANPPNLYEQSTYPDYYFRVTNSEHMQELKHKFQRICEKTMVKRRYLYLTEEILKERPKLCSYMEPSFDDRQDIVVEEVPKLAKEAATKAIKEWGRSMSDITHLVFCSISGIDMPGADYRLAKLLGLPLSVNRIMLYSQACHMGAAMLRIAKDLAENNKGARVLVVSCEITVLSFRGPDEHDFQALAGQAGFGDGAAAVIVGADPIQGVEKSIYEIVSATQVTVPESEKAVGGHLREVGLTFYFFSQLPMIIADNIENSLTEAFKPLGITNWNDIFWVAHPGNWAIMDAIERRLGLQPEKLSTARHVFSEYGNMQSATVYFVLDEVRKRSVTQGQSTTGDGLRWGVLFGFGPGLSIETVVLRGNPIFEMMSAAQVTVPDCEKAVGGHLKEIGLTFHFMNQLPMLISNNLENCLLEAFKPLGITDWNEVFWVSHPGNWGIMDAIEKKVGLKQEKLRSSRHVFGEYGNMMSATVLFVMDDVRKRSAAEGRATTGDGLEWGVLFGFGPGLTIETV
ncbi:hypothetical protein MUK42_14841, partial [Musa troglodytarum]